MRKPTDPRKVSGGSISGPGGPYGENNVVLDMTNAVLLDAVEVAIMGSVRDGVLDEKPVCAVLLSGRINKTTERAHVMFLMDEDGAAGIVTQIVGLQSRAGWSAEFLERVQERMKEMPL